MSASEQDVRLAGDLVREAGRLAQRMRAEGVSVEQKSSISDLVTAADHAAEEWIVSRLASERPDDGILGEEGATRESGSGRTWVIDPVDGTYNFVAGLTWWCSAIALVEDDDVLLGAVYHPHDDVLYVGGPGVPTTRNGVAVAPMPDAPLARVCMTTYLHPSRFADSVGEAFARAAGGAAAVRMLGSGSMDLTAIAQGELGVFCQQSVPPWDRLPGWGLVLGAGGAVAQVEAGGVEWSVAGAPTAVADVRSALEG